MSEKNDILQFQNNFGGNMEMISVPQERRRNTQRSYINDNNDNFSNQTLNSINSTRENTINEMNSSFISPVPPSLRSSFNPTYISPETNEKSNFSKESHASPQISANDSYKHSQSQSDAEKYMQKSNVSPQIPPESSYFPQNSYNIVYPTDNSQEFNSIPQFYQDTSFGYNYAQNVLPQSIHQPKERAYINPISEKEYERQRKKHDKAERTNIPGESASQKKESNESQTFFSMSSILWIIVFLIILCIFL